jgi:hypothetical protein
VSGKPEKPKIHRVSRRSLLLADPPRHLREEAGVLIPAAGLLAKRVPDMILPVEDRLWILLFACDLPERACLVFSRICALRCLRLWMTPYPEIVARYLRTGQRVLARTAREAAMPCGDDAMRAAAWATTSPLIDAERIDLGLRRWTNVSFSYRAYAAAASARKAGVPGESQISDLMTILETHPTVLAIRMMDGQFESMSAVQKTLASKLGENERKKGEQRT